MSEVVKGAIITTVGLLLVTVVNIFILRSGYLKETTKEILTKNRIKWISEVRKISIDLCSEITKLRLILDGNDSRIKELELNGILNNIIYNKESLSMYFNSKQSYDKMIKQCMDEAIYDLEAIITSRIRIANINTINNNLNKIPQNNKPESEEEKEYLDKCLKETKEYFKKYLMEIEYLNIILQKDCKFHKILEKNNVKYEEKIREEEAIIKNFKSKDIEINKLIEVINQWKGEKLEILNQYWSHILSNSGVIVNHLYLNLELMLNVYLKTEWERVKIEPFIKLKKYFFKRKSRGCSNNWNKACLEEFKEQFNGNENSYYSNNKELFIQRNIYDSNGNYTPGFMVNETKDPVQEKNKEELGKWFDSIIVIDREKIRNIIEKSIGELSNE